MESCPASKTEWDNAAFKKDCCKIALQQNCSSVEKFVYHCVINGYRNKTLEVCAPSRLIFGKIFWNININISWFCLFNGILVLEYCNLQNKLCIIIVFSVLGNCVEFNEQGGVIQDQISAPCNETFPKCDDIYLSSTAYKCKITKDLTIII